MFQRGARKENVQLGGNRIMPLPHEASHTESDYYNLPENVRAELINGQILYMAAPGRLHQKILMEIAGTIRDYIKSNNETCEIYPAPFAVELSDTSCGNKNIVEPDISVICDPKKLTDRGCTGAPDWIIEIVSPSNSKHDYITKLALYESAGVREYWIVDLAQKRVLVYLFKADAIVNIYTFYDTIKASIYEDFYIDFSSLIL